MRNRIYRGVCQESKELIFGSLVVGCSLVYITVEERTNMFKMVPVYPDTAGVCLDYKDIHGKMLFEGDHIKSKFGQNYTLVYSLGQILAENKHGFYFGIEQICSPSKIGGVYEKYLF